MTTVADLDLDGLLEVIEHEDHPVLVDFWTPTCAPCRTLKPHLVRFAEDRDEVRIVAVNAARETTAARHFNVKAVPTLIVFEGVSNGSGSPGRSSRRRLRPPSTGSPPDPRWDERTAERRTV